jgi:putative ABC transport system permease protein
VFTRLASIVADIVRRPKVEDDLNEEFRFHIQARADDLVRHGLARPEAERRARLEFGAAEARKEDCREARGLRVVDELVGNLRYALRSLRHTPGVTAAAVVSLALGIGANTAIFSVVNAVVLKPLPVEDPARLVVLSWTAKEFPQRYLDAIEGSVGPDARTGWTVSADLPSTTVDAIRAHNRVFSRVLAFSDNNAPSNVSIGGRADVSQVVGVSGDYFDALGVGALAGRVLHPSDDEATAPPVAVVSYPFWQRMLGGGPAAGMVLTVNGAPLTVVGVTPRQFTGLQPGRAPDLYVPLRVYVEEYRRAFAYDLRNPRVWWLTMVGRLKPGVSEAQARGEAGGLFHGSLGISGSESGTVAVPRLVTDPIGRLNDLRTSFAPILTLMMSMVGVVLLVACGNVASLLVARAAARHRDLAVRLSLGASRSRVIRQLLTESVLLGLLGGALGLVVGVWLSRAVVTSLANGPRDPIALNVTLDGAVLAFTALVSMGSGVLFGVVPALRATRGDVAHALTRRSDAGLPGSRTVRSGKLLVGAQVALCLVLLVGAGLLVGTLDRLQRVDLGFNPKGLVVLGVQPGLNGYADERLAAYYENLQRDIGELPGVRTVALSQHGLIGAGWSQGTAELPGSVPPLKQLRYYRHWVSGRFFETIGIPLVAGRRLGPEDGRTAPHAVVVNRRFVKDHLRGENPLGRTFKTGDWVGTIVGVVEDTKYHSLRGEAPPTAYLPYLQYPGHYPASMTVHVRVGGPAEPALTAIRRVALALDPTVPPVLIRTQQDIIDRALFSERTLAVLGASFGLLALVLACVGLFGTMSYSVARRTGEIGVRMALGAPRAAVLRMVLRETLAIAVAGIAVGLPFAWMGSRLMATLLFGVSPHDPATMAVAVSTILTVTVASGALPAIRASRVDPMAALRNE